RTREDVARVAVAVVLDAAARNGAGHLPSFGDRQLRADRARCGPSRRDDGGEREPFAACAPALDVGQQLFHAPCLLSIPASTPARSSRLARLCPATKRSTNGRAARIPPASGW